MTPHSSLLTPSPRLGLYGLLAVLGLSLIFFLMPVSADLLNGGIALSLLGTLFVLIQAISSPTPLKLSSFPMLLLILTLYRLSLNIASTRFILREGRAGGIIEGVAQLATGGHPLIGLIIFIIVTLVQFLVVAKGAERVAEVQARFTLDALPGKQMSIDADLRAGLINQKQAAERRAELEQSSQFFGAMDGAMKFVKGDTVAGLVITGVNLIGGTLVGLMIHGYDWRVCLSTYTLLTIGDGLISQIPSLCLAITAGLLITWVQEPRQSLSLSQQIWQQLGSQPRNLLIVSGLGGVIGFIPGFPSGVLWILSLLLAVLSYGLRWYKAHQRTRHRPISSYLITPTPGDRIGGVPAAVHPLALEVSSRLFAAFQRQSRWLNCFNNLYPALRRHLTDQLGVPIPALKLEVNDRLKQYAYSIRLFGIPVESSELDPHRLALLGPGARLMPRSGAVIHSQTVHGTPLALFPEGNPPKQTGPAHGPATIFEPEERLLRHLARILVEYAHEFVNIQNVRERLDQLECLLPELVHEVVPRLISAQKLGILLRRLVEEGIPIRDLRQILEIIALEQPDDVPVPKLLENIRTGLKPLITHLYTQNGRYLRAYTVSPEIVDKLRQGVAMQNGELCFQLSPDDAALILRGVHRELQHRPRQKGTVILTDREARLPLRKLIKDRYAHIPVLAHPELEPRVRILPVAEITLPTL